MKKNVLLCPIIFNVVKAYYGCLKNVNFVIINFVNTIHMLKGMDAKMKLVDMQSKE